MSSSGGGSDGQATRPPGLDSTAPDVGAAPAHDLLAPGATVGEYAIGAVIDRGGFGAVYRAEHRLLGRPAALKVLHSLLASDPEAVARMEREARAVNLIRHPNVIDVYDFGRLPDGRPYFVMELLAGEHLGARLARTGRCSAVEALEIFRPLCHALAAVHAKGVVHRDVKATNVFLDETGGASRVVLLDFGIAKLASSVDPKLTSSLHTVGTPSCMAPEQILGAQVSARTDVYALGVLAYQVLTGKTPFDEESPLLMQHLHLYATPPRASVLAPLPRAVDEALLRAMSKRPEDRYADCPAFLEAIEAALGGAGARPPAAQEGRTFRALAVHVDVRERSGAGADPAALDDLDAVLRMASERLESAGFSRAIDAGTSLLYVRELAQDPETERGARRAGIACAMALAAAVEARAGASPDVDVSLTMNVGSVTLMGTRYRGGSLLKVSEWVPAATAPGVLGPPAVFEGLDLAVEPAVEAPPLLRPTR